MVVAADQGSLCVKECEACDRSSNDIPELINRESMEWEIYICLFKVKTVTIAMYCRVYNLCKFKCMATLLKIGWILKYNAVRFIVRIWSYIILFEGRLWKLKVSYYKP